MQLNQATAEFLEGYFSTHERGKKTKAAYRSDLVQFETFAGDNLSLASLSVSIIERYELTLSPCSTRFGTPIFPVNDRSWQILSQKYFEHLGEKH